MRVFLIGYMASGKTTIGKKLARELDLPFVDLDEHISVSENMPISEIFESGGEALFRGLEMKYLKEVIEEKTSALISTGGGTPCFYSNMEEMKKAGLTVYLQMDAKSITYRLMNAKGDRPLVNNISESELLEFVEQQMKERKYFYEDAALTVNALGFNSGKIKSLADRIKELNTSV